MPYGSEQYSRAEALLPGNAERLIRGGEVSPEFVAGGDRFRFAERDRDGERLLLVDPEAGTCEPLPEDPAEPPEPGSSLSPDGRWAVRVAAGNVFLRERAGGAERQLTDDGTPLCPYASRLDYYALQRRLAGQPLDPVLLWSPDSGRFLFERLDQSAVGETHLLEVVEDEPRPRLHSYRDAIPGDEHLATVELFLAEVATGEVARVDLDPWPTSVLQPLIFGHFWFSPLGDRLEGLVQGRYQRDLKLFAIDPGTGSTRLVAEQGGDSVVDPNPLIFEERPAARVLDDGRALWVSERDGWAHLWLVDGEEWRQLTSGEWVVRELLHVDEKRQEALFTASGRESEGGPHDRRLYRVPLAGGEPRLLTPEPLDHAITVTPSGRWLVDCASSPRTAPRSVLRSAGDGAVVLELSSADTEELVAAGWRPPEPFTVVAADGETELHGALFFPPGFGGGGERSWPLLDVVYPGPQTTIVPRRFGLAETQFDSYAALGLVVMALDGRGTPLRSKQFHDASYRGLDFTPALDDHVAAIRQLADRHPEIDAERVGIVGISGGGHLAARALLAHPETFSVGISTVANHDNRRYHAGWGERYLGPPREDPDAWLRQSNVELAGRLRGRLLLGLAERDANVNPVATRALIAALVAADVDHDVVVMPHGDHLSAQCCPYFVRRSWDFLVRHLIGAEPPPYSIDPGSLSRPLFP